ncbi:unnamed protein product [Nezara viridula]|uniref:Protein kinase domain-containing protein n=1 Tax=Nezara viridula TaxID=85310 RepID=A0A9P0HBQ9_NEZVI|nr:unnamed protein product [Nezara viridula]
MLKRSCLSYVIMHYWLEVMGGGERSTPYVHRAVTDPRDGRRVALKKLPNVFQSLVSSKRVFRELKMLLFFKHENVSTFLCLLFLPL